MTEQCTLGIKEAAKQLVTKLEVDALPEDFDIAGLWYPQCVAKVRHNYTNYEQLLTELPLCVDYRDAGGACPHNFESGYDCPLKIAAHDTLKWAANDLAKQEYDAWLARRKQAKP